MKEISKTTRSKGMEYIPGQMVGCIRANGKMISRMERESISVLIKVSRKESGSKEKESNG